MHVPSPGPTRQTLSLLHSLLRLTGVFRLPSAERTNETCVPASHDFPYRTSSPHRPTANIITSIHHTTLFLHSVHPLGLRFPISHPQLRSTLTTLGVAATVSGTRMKMKLLWMAYASASWVQMPGKQASKLVSPLLLMFFF